MELVLLQYAYYAAIKLIAARIANAEIVGVSGGTKLKVVISARHAERHKEIIYDRTNSSSNITGLSAC